MAPMWPLNRPLFEHYTAAPDAIDDEAVAEYARTFQGRAAVAGAFGVYRAVPRTVEQIEKLKVQKLTQPILALGGEGSMGDRVTQMMMHVAENVTGGMMANCGHFIPEEQPDALVDQLAAVLLRG